MKWKLMTMTMITAVSMMLITADAQNASKTTPKASRITLFGDTNHPVMSVYIPGEPVKIHFTVDGLDPVDKNIILNVRVVNAKGAEIDRQAFLVSSEKPEWKIEMDAPVVGLGYYRVYANLSNGITLPQLGNRPAGFLTYAVMPDPATRKLYPSEQTYFGMQGGFNRHVNVLPYLGVRWVMDGQFGWSRTEPDHAGQIGEKLASSKKKFPVRDDDSWKWCRIPGKDGGKQWKVYTDVSGIVSPAPKWAQLDPKRFPRQGALSPEGERAFHKYCLTIGKVYAKLYPGRKRHYYEVTWEPCVPWNFKGTIDDVVEIYRIAYPALHEADPKAFVIGPCSAGISPGELQNLKIYLKKGLGKYIDGFSVHPYHQQPCETKGIVQDIRNVKRLLHKYLGRDIPMFGTEMGYSHWGSPGLELEHAQRITRENLILLGEGFQFNFAFYFHDLGASVFSHDSGYGFFHNLIPHAPFGPAKVSPKPAAVAYSAMTWLLEGHRSAGAIEWLGDTAWGYAYENDDDVTLGLWDFGDHPRQVSVPVGVPQVEVFDWMGNGSKVNAAEGNIQVTLGHDPIYIRGVSRKIWGKNAIRPIALKAKRLMGFPGSKVKLVGILHCPGTSKLFKGTLVMGPETSSGLHKATIPVAIEAGKTMPISFELNIPGDTGLGSYPVKLTLKDASGRSVAATGVRLEIKPPVAVEHLVPFIKPDGTKGLAVTLKESLGRGVKGTIRVRLERVPESGMSTVFALKSNETKTFKLESGNLAVSPITSYEAVVSVALKSGYSFSEKTKVNFMMAAPFSTPPVINADLSEWKDIPVVELKGLAEVVRSPKYYIGEKAKVRFAWDKKALYFAVEAEDKAKVQPYTGSLIWKGDCLQFGCNIDHGKKFELTGNGLEDMSKRARSSEMAFALTSKGPLVYRHMTYNPEKLKTGPVSEKAIPFAAAWKNGIYFYEAAIPWNELGFDTPPKKGDIIGFSLSINDSDAPNQPDPTALGMFDLKKVERFGMLVLQ